MALIAGAGNPVGGSNPSGTSSTLASMGNGYWAGWSGEVNAINGTDGTLFNFMSPSAAIDVTLSLQVDQTNLSGGESLGYEITMNGQIVGGFLAVVTAANTFLDFDVIYLIIPAFSEVEITCTTSDGQNIPFTALIRAQEI